MGSKLAGKAEGFDSGRARGRVEVEGQAEMESRSFFTARVLKVCARKESTVTDRRWLVV